MKCSDVGYCMVVVETAVATLESYGNIFGLSQIKVCVWADTVRYQSLSQSGAHE